MDRAFSQISYELTRSFFESWSKLKPFYEAYLFVDILRARARLHKNYIVRYQSVKEEGYIDVKNARHPLLYLQSPNQIVSNDLKVGESFQVAILTGPNAGERRLH